VAAPAEVNSGNALPYTLASRRLALKSMEAFICASVNHLNSYRG
jgi:hypothetical protein